MARIKTTVVRTGPFFEHDPAKTFRQNAEVMMEGIAAAGEREAKSLATPYRRTGAFLEGIRGRTHRLDGSPFKDPSAVVSQTHVYPWPGGAPKQYRGGRLESSWHIFRLTRSRVGVVSKLNQAELLKGLQ